MSQSQKKRLRKSLALMLLWGGVCGIAGIWSAQTSWDGVVYRLSKSQKRSLASIDLPYNPSDVKALSPKMFKDSYVFEHAFMETSLSHIVFHLGHIVIQKPSSEKVLACDEYSQIQMNVQSTDVVINGEYPTITITAPCLVSRDIKKIDPIAIPIAEVLEFDQKKFVKNNLTIREHHFFRWSTQWQLKSVVFLTKRRNQLQKYEVKGNLPFHIIK